MSGLCCIRVLDCIKLVDFTNKKELDGHRDWNRFRHNQVHTRWNFSSFEIVMASKSPIIKIWDQLK